MSDRITGVMDQYRLQTLDERASAMAAKHDLASQPRFCRLDRT
jgi:hypothetical protein